MRSVIVSLIAAMLVAACISSPEFYSMDDTADAGGGSSPIAVDPDATASADDDAATDPAIDDDAAEAPDTATPPGPPPTPPPPPTNMCPTAGAPAGAQCCGADNTAPLCVGIACAHCADCVAKGCAAGMICCAISPGKSGKYQSMTCALPNFAGFCP